MVDVCLPSRLHSVSPCRTSHSCASRSSAIALNVVGGASRYFDRVHDVESAPVVAVYVVAAGLPPGNENTLEPLVTAGPAFAAIVNEAGVGAFPPPVILAIEMVVTVDGAVTMFPAASSIAT